MFTSESVSKGHPDKVADQISDAILDEYFKQDPNSKVACETMVATNTVIVAGEIKSTANVNVNKVVRETIKEIGYDFDPDFHWDSVEIINRLHEQSADINQGVEREDGEIGAGDQGIMFGYAINEGNCYMPLTYEISNAILLEMDKARKNDDFAKRYLRPDAKSQVSIIYKDGIPFKIDTILVSTQHTEEANLGDIKDWVSLTLLPKVIKEYGYENLYKDYKLLVNPTGRFVVGGPVGDVGLTGRKIVVDQYGGKCPVGGGAFSGKDYSKVDRSAAYASRWLAKNIVASGLAEECLVQLSYAIGIPEPVSIFIDTYNTGKVSDESLEKYVKENFPLTPKWICDKFDLKNVSYKQTASYGHFGRNEFPWEKLDISFNI